MAAAKKASSQRANSKTKSAKTSTKAKAAAKSAKPAKVAKKAGKATDAPKKATKTRTPSKKAAQQPRKIMSKEAEQPENPEQIDEKSLETVRDILFGAQAREHDKRSEHLENLIKTSIAKIERDFDRKISGVEKTIEKLKDQIQKDNTATAEKVSNRFNETNSSISALDAKTQSDLGDLQDQTNADLNNLESTAKNWNEDLAKQLELVHQQLLHAKADRASLSELFASMAVAIADDSKKG